MNNYDTVDLDRELDRHEAGVTVRDLLRRILHDPALLEIARKDIEDTLVMMRDERMFTLSGNGLVIREKDGGLSDVIRLSTGNAVYQAVQAIAEATPEKVAATRDGYARYLARQRQGASS